MLEFDFLSADVPLTKRFSRDGDLIEVQSYPIVRNLTSHREQAESLQDLLPLLQHHAQQGHALLKGNLSKQIQNQSRAGLTSAAEPTQWLALDLDFDSGWDSPADFVDALGPEFYEVSFIFQHSASAGITSKAGLRGHIFILLDKPVLPTHIKSWLQSRNLFIDKLRSRLSLAANGVTLRWPLDITTCQNDKIIFIAPPVCEGLDDPLHEERITLHERMRAAVEFPKEVTPQGRITSEIESVIADRRAALGLSRRKARYRDVQGFEVLSNPEEATVTGMKMERGFTYLNLNGGDSWAYYFPYDNPKLLFNFKGEPIVELKKLAPEFYRTYTNDLKEIQELEKERERLERQQEQQEKAKSMGFEPIVFRDPARDTYYNMIYYPDKGEATVHSASSLIKLDHFMRQYGFEMPDPVEDWTIEFNPTTNQIIDRENRWVNSFSPTEFLRLGPEGAPSEPPATIHKIIDSVCASDEESIRHFYNWLAFIFQYRRKTETAWIFHGVSGTGKGVLVSKVLKPLFGQEHVVEFTSGNLEDQFNAPLERALILWLDELHLENSRQTSQVMNKLKNIITEKRMVIRGMRQNPITVDSYLNVIIATNHPDPVRIPEHDRRMNVAPPQEQKLTITLKDIDRIEEELESFARYLAAYEVNHQQVRSVLKNEARANMVVASQTTVERMFAAVRTGNLAFFLEFADHVAPMQDTVMHADYIQLMARWVDDALNDRPSAVAMADMRRAYLYIIGGAISPAKFARIAVINRLPKKTIRINGRATSGTEVRWQVERDLLVQFAMQKPELKLITNEETMNEETQAEP